LFHLTDLPSDLIFFYLKEDFRKEFLIKLKMIFGNYQKAAECVRYTNTGITDTFRVKNRFTKLLTIIKLANFLSKKEYKNFDLKKIEKKVVAYRGIRTSLIIKNPKFPLKEDERMIRKWEGKLEQF